jgi:hypothetical protein
MALWGPLRGPQTPHSSITTVTSAFTPKTQSPHDQRFQHAEAIEDTQTLIRHNESPAPTLARNEILSYHMVTNHEKLNLKLFSPAAVLTPTAAEKKKPPQS